MIFNKICVLFIKEESRLSTYQKSTFSDGAKRKDVLSNIHTELFFCSCVTAICCLIHIANYPYGFTAINTGY